MRTRKIMVTAAAAVGAAGALAVGGVALADQGEPVRELWIVNEEQSGSTGDGTNCPEKDQGSAPGTPTDEQGTGQL